jgi:hypothetical protein
MNVGKLVPCGTATYDLGLAEDAKARSIEGTVELTLQVSFDGAEARLVKVRLSRDVAREFALQLVQSAAKISCLFLGVLGDLDQALDSLSAVPIPCL